MYDNQLIKLFRSVIIQGLSDYGFSNVQVVQSGQPTQQGINNTPTVYFYKIGDHRYGFNKFYDEWSDAEQKMIHKEVQFYESTFQINALVAQNPQDTNGYTATDIVNIVSSVLQSEKAIKTLMDEEVGILRISEIRSSMFIDDRDRHEYIPSFDFTLTHKNIRISSNPIVTTVESGIYPI